MDLNKIELCRETLHWERNLQSTEALQRGLSSGVIRRQLLSNCPGSGVQSYFIFLLTIMVCPVQRQPQL